MWGIRGIVYPEMKRVICLLVLILFLPTQSLKALAPKSTTPRLAELSLNLFERVIETRGIPFESIRGWLLLIRNHSNTPATLSSLYSLFNRKASLFTHLPFKERYWAQHLLRIVFQDLLIQQMINDHLSRMDRDMAVGMLQDVINETVDKPEILIADSEIHSPVFLTQQQTAILLAFLRRPATDSFEESYKEKVIIVFETINPKSSEFFRLRFLKEPAETGLFLSHSAVSTSNHIDASI